jgi:rubrerythrin
LKQTYNIDELNKEIRETRLKNINFTSKFVEKLQLKSDIDRRSMPNTEKLKCHQRGVRAFKCHKCNIVYHGTNVCPLCDAEALTNSTWCAQKVPQFHTATGRMNEGCHWSQLISADFEN